MYNLYLTNNSSHNKLNKLNNKFKVHQFNLNKNNNINLNKHVLNSNSNKNTLEKIKNKNSVSNKYNNKFAIKKNTSCINTNINSNTINNINIFNKLSSTAVNKKNNLFNNNTSKNKYHDKKFYTNYSNKVLNIKTFSFNSKFNYNKNTLLKNKDNILNNLDEISVLKISCNKNCLELPNKNKLELVNNKISKLHSSIELFNSKTNIFKDISLNKFKVSKNDNSGSKINRTNSFIKSINKTSNKINSVLNMSNNLIINNILPENKKNNNDIQRLSKSNIKDKNNKDNKVKDTIVLNMLCKNSLDSNYLSNNNKNQSKLKNKGSRDDNYIKENKDNVLHSNSFLKDKLNISDSFFNNSLSDIDNKNSSKDIDKYVNNDMFIKDIMANKNNEYNKSIDLISKNSENSTNKNNYNLCISKYNNSLSENYDKTENENNNRIQHSILNKRCKDRLYLLKNKLSCYIKDLISIKCKLNNLNFSEIKDIHSQNNDLKKDYLDLLNNKKENSIIYSNSIVNSNFNNYFVKFNNYISKVINQNYFSSNKKDINILNYSKNSNENINRNSNYNCLNIEEKDNIAQKHMLVDAVKNINRGKIINNLTVPKYIEDNICSNNFVINNILNKDTSCFLNYINYEANLISLDFKNRTEINSLTNSFRSNLENGELTTNLFNNNVSKNKDNNDSKIKKINISLLKNKSTGNIKYSSDDSINNKNNTNQLKPNSIIESNYTTKKTNTISIKSTVNKIMQFKNSFANKIKNMNELTLLKSRKVKKNIVIGKQDRANLDKIKNNLYNVYIYKCNEEEFDHNPYYVEKNNTYTYKINNKYSILKDLNYINKIKSNKKNKRNRLNNKLTDLLNKFNRKELIKYSKFYNDFNSSNITKSKNALINLSYIKNIDKKHSKISSFKYLKNRIYSNNENLYGASAKKNRFNMYLDQVKHLNVNQIILLNTEEIKKNKLDRLNDYQRMFYYIKENYYKHFKLLFNKYKCKLDIVDTNNINLLMQAAKYNRIDISEYLIEKGIDLDYKDNSNNTALHLAAKMKNYKVIDLLISKKATQNIKNNDNLTYYDYLIINNN